MLSLCDQRVENIEVKSLRCTDALGPLVKIDVNTTADIVTKGLGIREYEANEAAKWFTIHIEAFIRDKLEILDGETWTKEYNPTKFDRLTTLNEFLIPYIYTEDLEDEADNFFETYCVDAIYTTRWMLPLDHILREMRITCYEDLLPKNVFGRMYLGNVLNQVNRESSAKEAALMTRPTTMSCIGWSLKKRRVFLTGLLHQVRGERCLRSMRCAFFFPVTTVLSVMRLL